MVFRNSRPFLHSFFIVVLGLVSSLVFDQPAFSLPAFPGAEGFGAETIGGRGGRVIAVTNLNDSGPGSFRAACEAEGSRIVVFRVSGLIPLKSKFKITHPNITIAGQTAPGQGICIKDVGVNIDADQVILRHLRFRPGDPLKKEMDSLSIGAGKDIIIDHCSASWSIDETLSINGDCDRLTVQWCIISESLNKSFHKKGDHGYGSLIVAASGAYSFHHNAYIHNNSRNPRPGAKENMPGLRFDFRNNLIYNWGMRAGYDSQTAVRMNYIGNYLKPGPSAWESGRNQMFLVGGPLTRLFAEGNVLEGYPDETRDNWLAIKPSEQYLSEEDLQKIVRVNEPFPSGPVTTDSPEAAYQKILAGAGATLPARDAVDRRLMEDIKSGTGKIINSQDEVGGWPEYKSAEPPIDSDNDGMPDDWEKSHGLNPEGAADGNQDRDGDGYTNIEEYINGIMP
jgi:pectate lyase